MPLESASDIGAVLFGAGWGWSGCCPVRRCVVGFGGLAALFPDAPLRGRMIDPPPKRGGYRTRTTATAGINQAMDIR